MNMNYPMLWLLLSLLAFHSCVFSELKECRDENAHLTARNEALKSQLLTREAAWKVDSNYLSASIEGLESDLNFFRSQTPEELARSVDSMEREMQRVRRQLDYSYQSKAFVQDTLQELRAHLHRVYAIPGCKSDRLRTESGTFDTYRVDTRTASIRFFWKNEADQRPFGSLDRLQNRLETEGELLVFATNGGMYRPDQSPQGLFIENGLQKTPIDRQQGKYGNFYLQPNGVFLIDSLGRGSLVLTEAFDSTIAGKARYATQSGPMLLVGGAVNARFNPRSKSKKFRSGVGIVNQDELVFVISNQPVSFYEFATVFQIYFGCTDALYLDGTISRMYLPQLGRFQGGGNFGPIIGIVK